VHTHLKTKLVSARCGHKTLGDRDALNFGAERDAGGITLRDCPAASVGT
jgi:hypothetical protein